MYDICTICTPTYNYNSCNNIFLLYYFVFIFLSSMHYKLCFPDILIYTFVKSFISVFKDILYVPANTTYW